MKRRMDHDLEARAQAALKRSMEKPGDGEPPGGEARRHLVEMLRPLPPVTRDIFLAHRIDRLTYAEIADATGLGVADVERHVAQAIEAICAPGRGRLRAVAALVVANIPARVLILAVASAAQRCWRASR